VAVKTFNLLSEADRKAFPCDVTKINWQYYIMNCAYGLKKFVLEEEAELPSLGQLDSLSYLQEKQPSAMTFYRQASMQKIRDNT
jgi:hypothetical protein